MVKTTNLFLQWHAPDSVTTNILVSCTPRGQKLVSQSTTYDIIGMCEVNKAMVRDVRIYDKVDQQPV